MHQTDQTRCAGQPPALAHRAARPSACRSAPTFLITVCGVAATSAHHAAAAWCDAKPPSTFAEAIELDILAGPLNLPGLTRDELAARLALVAPASAASAAIVRSTTPNSTLPPRPSKTLPDWLRGVTDLHAAPWRRDSFRAALMAELRATLSTTDATRLYSATSADWCEPVRASEPPEASFAITDAGAASFYTPRMAELREGAGVPDHAGRPDQSPDLDTLTRTNFWKRVLDELRAERGDRGPRASVSFKDAEGCAAESLATVVAERSASSCDDLAAALDRCAPSLDRYHALSLTPFAELPPEVREALEAPANWDSHIVSTSGLASAIDAACWLVASAHASADANANSGA